MSKMEIRKVTVVLVVLGLVWCCEGKFVVETSKLKVSSPDSLKGTYECAIGNFGVPDYGGSMAGTVFYPKSNQDACLSFEDFNVSFSSKPGGLPTFLLADRGDCYFTTKAWNAQTVGAAAVLVANDRPGPLVTMDTPRDDPGAIYLPNITIPSVLINKSLADDMKKSILGGELVKVNLDWSEALPHPDNRVEYEFWTNSNDECGPECETQTKFVQDFKGAAQILEQKGYTQFTPHYVTWYCPDESRETKACKSQCINQGRYCAPDPEGDLSEGYEGKDVVVQNLREACFFKVVNESGKPWLWWDFVTDFITRCPMKDKKFGRDCAARVIQSLGVDLKKVDECVGDTDADAENPILDYQQDAQIGHGSRGDIKILPTLVINNRQYRGKLERRAVLKAICSGFRETTEPAICLNGDIQTNQCLDNNGGCWEDKAADVTACRDTFRGRVCECPTVQGVKFVGDGYTHCEASGPSHCAVHNGGCWKETRDNQTYSACVEGSTMGCECPPGFKGDGLNCEDVDECKAKLFCHCPECKCKDKWGGFDCSCSSGLLYIRELDTCIRKDGSAGSGWNTFWIIVLGLAAFGAGGYLIYKYRLRRFMDSEIRSIMAQYMPLDDNRGGYEPISSGHVEAPNPQPPR